MFLLKGALDASNVHHHPRLEPISVVHLEVIPVGPLAGSAVSVVCVVNNGQVVPRCPLKVWQADHVGQVGQLAGGKVGANLVEKTSVGLIDEDACAQSTCDECRESD